ncbi:hypothetical protein SCA03_63160 [Streptomyces cacaoi]|uniref:Uncharacterized protein n=1 Tax=Streptomyces cacaoi TaxID=1898 RepID=A0A4Y3R7Q2_STRCI|nr:hypothetical protein SCA03_63160 [Streptomyces cacaoi]
MLTPKFLGAPGRETGVWDAHDPGDGPSRHGAATVPARCGPGAELSTAGGRREQEWNGGAVRER